MYMNILDVWVLWSTIIYLFVNELEKPSDTLKVSNEQTLSIFCYIFLMRFIGRNFYLSTFSL